MRLSTLKQAVAAGLTVLMAMNVFPIGLAQAEMITTDQVLQDSDPADDRAKVETFLAREDVKDQLVVLGVDPAEAAVRVASLTDAELAQIAGRLDELPAGEGAVGAIVGAIVFIFLVLLITDLLGLTDVFPFVKKH